MLQLKSLTTLKMKEKQKEYAEKYKIKEEENFRIKNQMQLLKKELEQSNVEVSKWKGKFDKLKEKYRELFDKFKSRCEGNMVE